MDHTPHPSCPAHGGSAATVRTHWQLCRAIVAFGAVSGLSLGLLSWVDRPLHAWLRMARPGLEVIPAIRLPSLVACALLYIVSGPRGSYRLPRGGQWRTLAIMSLAWLVPAAFFILVVRVWVPQLPRGEDLVAFMLTGLVAEELLFRGAVYQTALDLVGPRRVWRLPLPVLVSALCFALSHLQYHSFQPSTPALTQVGYTAVMGVFLAYPRWLTGSLWPCVLLHVLNNSLTLLR